MNGAPVAGTPAEIAESCDQALREVGANVIARVRVEERAVDLAIRLSHDCLAVVHCSNAPADEDRFALETMIVEGDFVWAGIVEGGSVASAFGGVETFQVTELDRLVARLSQLQEAYREAH